MAALSAVDYKANEVTLPMKMSDAHSPKESPPCVASYRECYLTPFSLGVMRNAPICGLDVSWCVQSR